MRYTILDPTGNVTALVESAVAICDQPRVADAIMEAHPEVEQVGFVSLEGMGPGIDVGMRMAGGEFCGNATMSTAALFAERRLAMATGDEVSVIVRVSGTDRPLEVRLRREEAGFYTAAVMMPEALSHEMPTLAFDGSCARVPLVLMQGISHLIIESDCEYFWLLESPAAAEAAVRQFAEEIGSDGLGLMFFDGTADGGVLTPLVYVPRANTCFWEHSCASGTSAAAMYLARRLNSRIDASFEEPGGILAVTSEPAGQTWLKGSVRIVSDHEL